MSYNRICLALRTFFREPLASIWKFVEPIEVHTRAFKRVRPRASGSVPSFFSAVATEFKRLMDFVPISQ